MRLHDEIAGALEPALRLCIAAKTHIEGGNYNSAYWELRATLKVTSDSEDRRILQSTIDLLQEEIEARQ
jgi:hypothetical protein